MNENNSLSDLEQMRSQMVELKSMLKEQSIVNGKMMRKAMKSDYNRMRNDMKFSIVFEVLALPMMWYVLPMLGLPLWFVAVTVVPAFGFGSLGIFSFALCFGGFDERQPYGCGAEDCTLQEIRHLLVLLCHSVPRVLAWYVLLFRY